MLLKFSQQETVHRASVLEEMISHLPVEFIIEQNQLILYLDPHQPSPINTMLASFVHFSSFKSSSSSDVSECETLGISPIQVMPIGTTSSDPQPSFFESHQSENQNNLHQPNHKSQPDIKTQP